MVSNCEQESNVLGVQQKNKGVGLMPKRSKVTRIIERVEIVDEERKRALIVARLAEEGYRILSIGPYSDAKTFPGVNLDWFHLEAEKEVKR